ncbi:MAG: glycosyltransferase [Bacteroidota bacterium]
MAKRIICTVTNDLSYDQRMQRIARSLVKAGYEVTLLGRVLPNSKPLVEAPFGQIRMRCYFRKGFLFYGEYNLRLCWKLLWLPFDAVCTVDLDSLPAGCIASVLRGKKRVFDAHEYFTEVPEVVNRPFVKAFWGLVARIFLPFYRHAYTVGPSLASIFTEKYHIPFEVVRNVPFARVRTPETDQSNAKVLLYQGALNEGRGIEAMLEAMTMLDGVQFWLAGEGDLSQILRQKADALGLHDKVRFLGYVDPRALKDLTEQAWLGLNLLENKGLSYYYSLANKFFDSIQAYIPVLTVDFPEYRDLNAQYEVAVLLPDIQPKTVAAAIQQLLSDEKYYNQLKTNCIEASKSWIWENEQEVLLKIWAAVMK